MGSIPLTGAPLPQIKLTGVRAAFKVVPMRVWMTAGCALSAAVALPMFMGNLRAAAYVPPASCRVWYDGCNKCERTVDNKVICTHRLCSESGKGFCEVSFPASMQVHG